MIRPLTLDADRVDARLVHHHGSARRIAVALGAALAAIVLGCEPSGLTVHVDVQTGLLPGREFGFVTVEVAEGVIAPGTMPRGSRLIGEPATSGDARFTRGARIAELDLTPGTYTFRGVLRRPAPPGIARDAGAILIERWITVPVTSDRVVRIPLTGDCVAVECPAPAGSASFDQCMNGRCVDPRCDPGDPSTFDPYCCDATVDDCSEPTVCVGDGDCTPVAACVGVTCDEGVCVESDDTCGPGAWCARETGACEGGATADAGVPDGGLDAGPCDGVVCPFACVEGECRGPEWIVATPGLGTAHDVVAVDGGHVVVGELEGSVAFDGCEPLVSTDAVDAFVARFDDVGVCEWARGFGGVGDDQAHGVVADDLGNVYVTGRVASAIDFGGGVRPATGDDLFVASFDRGGSHRWSWVGGSTMGRDVGAAIARDDGVDQLVVAGAAGGGWTFGATTFSADPSNTEFVVLRFDSAGVPVDAISGGGASFDSALDVAVVDGGLTRLRADVVVVGTVNGMADLNGPLAAGGGVTAVNDDAFVARFAGDGALRWHREIFSDEGGDDEGHAVALTRGGAIIVSALVASGPLDVNGVLVEIPPDGVGAAYTIQIGLDGVSTRMADGVADVAVDDRGHVHLAGTTSGTWTFAGTAVEVDAGACPAGCESPLLARLAPDGTPSVALVRSGSTAVDYFAAVATDGDRDVVVGSVDGQVRIEAIRLRP